MTQPSTHAPPSRRGPAELRATAWWAALLVVVLVGTPIVSADVLVTKEGERIETDGPWEVDGRRVIFTAANGRLSALPLSAVDLEASELATNPPPPPPPPEPAPPPERPRLPRPDPDRPEPVLVLTDEDIPRAPPEFGEGGDESGDGLLAGLKRLLAGGIANPAGDPEMQEEIDRVLGEDSLAGAGETVKLLAEVMGKYPELTEMNPGDPEAIRRNADSIRAAAEDLRAASETAETEQARRMLRTAADLMEAKLGGSFQRPTRVSPATVR